MWPGPEQGGGPPSRRPAGPYSGDRTVPPSRTVPLVCGPGSSCTVPYRDPGVPAYSADPI
eukprot:112570-Hanusia_phi.AAC.1